MEEDNNSYHLYNFLVSLPYIPGAYNICRLLRSEVYSFQKPKYKNDDSRRLHQIRAAELGATGNPLAPLVPLSPLCPIALMALLCPLAPLDPP